MRRFLEWLSGSLLRFHRDERANVAMMFGITIIPVIGLAGAALDYSQAARARQQIQEAVDAAALAGSRVLTRPDNEVHSVVNAYITANQPRNVALGTPTIQILNERRTLTVSLGGVVTTAVLPLVGINTIDVRASTETTFSEDTMEVALVLDNTGSMAGTKISTLRTAVSEFVTAMEAAANGRPDAIRVGIVPFDRHVNMGVAYKNQPWINFSLRSGSPSTWNGCVTDRNQSYDVNDTPPATLTAATHFFAVDCSLEPVTPLTSDWTALRASANRMRAAGNTNVTIGVAHGFHLLSNAQPYTEARAPQDKLRKVMIVLTDGDNTQNRWTTNGNTIDARTAIACTNVKAAGIVVYTVRVINGDANLLRNCATSPTQYYDIRTVDELRPVFARLAAEISALRLSR